MSNHFHLILIKHVIQAGTITPCRQNNQAWERRATGHASTPGAAPLPLPDSCALRPEPQRAAGPRHRPLAALCSPNLAALPLRRGAFCTCCSRDDSFRVEVGQKQAVDERRFSEPRFTLK